MQDGDILIVKGNEVSALLAGRELDLINAVRMSYKAHASGSSSLPQSSFLLFPGDAGNRIIALPAFLGDGFDVAGIKWIASFPDNLNKGIDRASAVLVLNSVLTGRPEAFIEGSIISAKRTAASAALAAQTLNEDRRVTTVGMIGTGLINFEIARFLRMIFHNIERLIVFDLDESRANQFRDISRHILNVEVDIAKDIKAVLKSSPIISFATTASKPHVFSLEDCPPGATVLHISLRDLSPQLILSSDNIVDDPDHVCRAQTSVHLAEQLVGNRDFIRCKLADIINGTTPPRRAEGGVAVFSPFGLGVLDLAVGRLVRELALDRHVGIVIDSFLPRPWSDHSGN